ncbi:MAG: acetyltransferase [Flavobacteriales bacterium]|nr:MAG: acetyltransferase [Flavobacteriales bacterium]
MIKYYKIYGFYGLIRLIRDKLYTYLYYPNARIIRLPFYIREKKGIRGAKSLTTGVNLRIDIISRKNFTPTLQIGDNVQFNDYVHIAVAKGVFIGDNTLIASKVFISDHNHGNYANENQSNPNTPPIERELFSKEVHIGNNVWIGEFVSVLPGVTIGEGSIIGSTSVVSKDIPAFSIAVGSPAKVIKTYDKDTNKWVNKI